jgi:hypothetical protein
MPCLVVTVYIIDVTYGFLKFHMEDPHFSTFSLSVKPITDLFYMVNIGGVRIYNLARGAHAAPGSMDPLVILQARFLGCQIIRKGCDSSSNYLDALHSYSRTTTLLLQHPTMMATAKEGLQAIVDIFSSTLGTSLRQCTPIRFSLTLISLSSLHYILS